MQVSLPVRLALALSLAGLAGIALADTRPAQAGTGGATGRYCQDIDPNTFLVGHPASPRWVVRHANFEHPAVVIAREAAAHPGAIDPNTFIVQPPVAVTWLERSDEVPMTTLAAR